MKPTRILVFLAIGLYGCATAPVSELAPGERPALESDEAGIWQAMDRDEFKLRTSAAVIRDPALQQYLESVLCRVQPDYCSDIRVYVIASPSFNAWMAPNGMMGIHTGLLLRIQDEAQLAAVMAHELAHYQRRHTLQQWRSVRARATGLRTLGTIVSVAAAAAADDADAALASGDYGRAASRINTASKIADAGAVLLSSLSIWSVLETLAFSRDHETESDDLSLEWLAASGYEPGVVGDLWAYVSADDKESESGRSRYLGTHPLPEERMMRNRNLGKELAAAFPNAQTSNSKIYNEVINPYRPDWLSSAQAGLDRPSHESLLDRQRYLGVDAGLILFHEAEMLGKRDGDRNASRALVTYQRAVQHPGAPPEAYREIGLLLRESNQSTKARDAFREYLARSPEAFDAELIQSYLKESSE